MPIDPSKDPVLGLAVASSDFMDALNRQPLKITGLAAGNYALKIDGETVGSFSSAALAEGVNLATLATPMAKQAAEVHALTLKHNNVHFFRWRTLQTVLEADGFNTATPETALDTLEEQIIGAQRMAAQPRCGNTSWRGLSSRRLRFRQTRRRSGHTPAIRIFY